MVTSHTKRSRQNSNALQNTSDGVKPNTDAKADRTKEAEQIRDLIARLMDIRHSWHLVTSEEIPVPLLSSENDYLVIALPKKGHVIKLMVTSKGSENFLVDGIPVIPDYETVTSKESDTL